MEKFKLNNGVEIPAIALGVFRIEDQKITYETVKSALELGYRHIDTAMIYGNEEAVGKAVKDSGIPRREIFVTTKLWNDDQRSGKVEGAIDASLNRLGLDYVDLYLVHWPVKEHYVEVWKRMEKVYKEGKAKAIGVSNYNPHHLDDLLKTAEIVPAVNQIECYPYLAQQPVIDYCQAKGIRPEAWGPLGAGKTDVLGNQLIEHIAGKYGKTSAQVVLRWNLQRGVIVIPKSVHRERQAQNLNITDFELTPEELKQITSLDKNLRLGSDPDNFDF
ncbi:aldo/keto reductase [Parabacteroides sp. Marseille-P3160]|uniref:aldo/keto reductase n=1 Tax=Parabacteroides sp. Marseille-P3160 TaxID=1917887 RepID=UPI0009BC14C6|nr:aldo/keto reductase [Parabacteroides sp. Marseille-P3160]